MRTKPFILTSICGTVLLLVAAGTGLYINEMNKKNLANGEKISTTQPLKDELPADLMTIDEIKSIVFEESPNVEVHTVVLEKSADEYQYKTQLNNGTVIYFNARTGKRISTTHNDAHIAAPPIESINIGFNDARQIALASNPSGVVSKIELLNENNTSTYCVWFGDTEHIDVRANDGAVTHVDLKRAQPAQSDKNNAPQPNIPVLDKVQERVRDNTPVQVNLPL